MSKQKENTENPKKPEPKHIPFEKNPDTDKGLKTDSDKPVRPKQQ